MVFTTSRRNGSSQSYRTNLGSNEVVAGLVVMKKSDEVTYAVMKLHTKINLSKAMLCNISSSKR